MTAPDADLIEAMARVIAPVFMDASDEYAAAYWSRFKDIPHAGDCDQAEHTGPVSCIRCTCDEITRAARAALAVARPAIWREALEAAAKVATDLREMYGGPNSYVAGLEQERDEAKTASKVKDETIDRKNDELFAAIARTQAAEARVKVLTEALTPFASMYLVVDWDAFGDDFLLPPTKYRFTVGELRRAYEAKNTLEPEFPKPRRKDGKPPCGECHLAPGEICCVCGAALSPLATEVAKPCSE